MCLYSAESMLLHSASAAAQNLASKPRLASVWLCVVTIAPLFAGLFPTWVSAPFSWSEGGDRIERFIFPVKGSVLP